MTYPEIKAALESLLKWMEGNDDAGWEAQVDRAEECRADLERMARPNYRRGKSGPDHNPKLDKAIPHVRAMLASMRSCNRTAALEHGKAAVAAM